MSTTQQAEFIQSLEGELTPEQAAQLLEMGNEGDTGAKALESGGEPGASASTGEGGDTNGEAGKTVTNTGTAAAADTGGATTDLNSDNAVILAKDGKHTIGYDKLVEAREGEKHWRGIAESTQQQLAQLQSDAAARAAAGEAATKTDNQVAAAEAAIASGADPGLFGDFSEEALAKGIEALVSQQVAARLAPIEAKLAPVQQKQQSDAHEAHYRAIYEKHPDADSLVESKELADWIGSQPSFVRDGYAGVLQKGTTDQVVELFDRFKQATGGTQAAADDTTAKVDVKAAAKAAIANTTAAVPSSLSDFPGGRIGAGTQEEALAGIESGTDLLDAMSKMNPEQIETFLNRRV